MFKELLLESENSDIIHNHMLWMAPSYYSGIVAGRTKTPYINTVHGSLSSWALSRSKLKKRLSMLLGQKRALQNTDFFHVTAKHEIKEISNLGYKKPFILIPNGIHIPKLGKIKDSTKRNLLFLSRLHPKKGLDILIDAWIIIHKKFPDWNLLIIGPADDLNYVNKLKIKLKESHAERFQFIGEITGAQKFEYFFRSDLFVLPSYSENFGLVVAEALSCQVPVICSKGAPWEDLNKHNAGWWIEIGLDPLIKSLIHAMSLERNKLKRLGINGRNWMINEYAWSEIARDFTKTYDWIINNGEQPNHIIK